MAVRGGFSPSSRLICETVNSVGQGYFTFVRRKSEENQEFQKPLAVATIKWEFVALNCSRTIWI